MTWSPLLTESELKTKQQKFAQRFRYLLDTDPRFAKSFVRLLKKDEELETLWVTIRNAIVYEEK